MLIRNAEVDGRICHVRSDDTRIVAIGIDIAPDPEEPCVEAHGGALLPGLHDHHIHLNAAAAAMASVRCGPPWVEDAANLIEALHAAPGAEWLRGIGYHPSIAGEIGREWLDRHGPDRPIRIQHRGGRMWYLNSRALALLGPDAPVDGRLLDGDGWLRERLGQQPPDLAPLGRALAALGVTGLTEVTPRNGPEDFERFATAGLPQHLLIMGNESLNGMSAVKGAELGALKLHYHDHDLPPLDVLTSRITAAHKAGRAIAAHCVTRAELFLTLLALEQAGGCGQDRIEHAAVAPPEAVDWMVRLGVTVVTQPHFLTERADAYLTDVAEDDLPWLYRLRGFTDAGIPLAAGSDAPFGSFDPWQAMAAAVHRPSGFGEKEALTPEQALSLYTGTATDPGRVQRTVAVGQPSDLCLIDRSWHEARRDLSAVRVQASIVGAKRNLLRPGGPLSA